MLLYRSLLVLSLFLAGLAPASAQLQVNPYVGLATGNQSVNLTGRADDVATFAGDRWLVGVDVLAGAGQLAPLAGLVYRAISYESNAGEVFNYGRISLPLGLAYRILAADFDLNIVLHGAVMPGLSFGDDTAFDNSIEHGLDWQGRGGLTLYLGTVTLGGQYVYAFSDQSPLRGRDGSFVLTLGGRF